MNQVLIAKLALLDFFRTTETRYSRGIFYTHTHTHTHTHQAAIVYYVHLSSRLCHSWLRC